METPVRAPFAGRVRDLLVAVNAQVDSGAALMSLERAGEEATAGEAVDLPEATEEAAATPADGARRALDELRSLIVGYDIATADVPGLLATHRDARARLAGALRQLRPRFLSRPTGRTATPTTSPPAPWSMPPASGPSSPSATCPANRTSRNAFFIISVFI